MREGRWGGGTRGWLWGGGVVGAQEGVGEVQVGVLSLVEALQGGGETVDDRGGGGERG